ncbi:MAG: hypothetical protein FWD11_10260, partial [Micrococcales bacterium]|nr:hypothetical protein [Micrococcales bacterium]
MRRSALIAVPLFALAIALVTGCGGSSGGGGNDACPVGKWEADNNQMVESMGLNDDSIDVKTSGTFKLEFTSSSFNGRWDQTIDMSAEGEKGNVTVDATLKGTWSGPDDKIEMKLEQADGTMKQSFGGQTDTVDLGEEWDSGDDGDPAIATCSGSKLTMNMGDGMELVF